MLNAGCPTGIGGTAATVATAGARGEDVTGKKGGVVVAAPLPINSESTPLRVGAGVCSDANVPVDSHEGGDGKENEASCFAAAGVNACVVAAVANKLETGVGTAVFSSLDSSFKL